MTRMLRCGAVIPGCEFVAHGENDSDVLMKEAEHARNAHGLDRVSDALKAKIRAAIRDQA